LLFRHKKTAPEVRRFSHCSNNLSLKQVTSGICSATSNNFWHSLLQQACGASLLAKIKSKVIGIYYLIMFFSACKVFSEFSDHLIFWQT
jgi:hypothetical protein